MSLDIELQQLTCRKGIGVYYAPPSSGRVMAPQVVYCDRPGEKVVGKNAPFNTVMCPAHLDEFLAQYGKLTFRPS